MRKLRICLAQINTTVGDMAGNVQKILEAIAQARSLGVDIIAFPELTICGYPPEDLLFKPQFIEENLQSLNQVVEQSSDLTVIVGFVDSRDGIYNAAAILHNGKLAGVYHKIHLPNYGVFEERKYFSHGKHIPVFRLNDFTIAVLICNDLWHPSLPYLGVCQKADVFVTIFSSSEGAMGTEFSNIESWGIVNTFYSRVFGIYNICANRVGEEEWEEKRSQ